MMMLGKIKQKIINLLLKLYMKMWDGVFCILIIFPYAFLTKEGWRWMMQGVRNNIKPVLVGVIITFIIYNLKISGVCL